MFWNLARLGECLLPLSSREAIEPVFESFSECFHAALTRRTFARLGLLPGPEAAARELMHAFWGAMQATEAPFQQAFYDLLGGADPARLRASPFHKGYETADWAEVIDGLRALEPAPTLPAALAHPFAGRGHPETLVIAEVEARWSAIDRDDDWAPLHAKVASIREAGGFNALLAPIDRPGHLPLDAAVALPA